MPDSSRGPYIQRIQNDAREDEMEDNMQVRKYIDIFYMMTMGQIIYFFDGRTPSRHVQSFSIHQVLYWNIFLKELLS